ncbi:MAG: DUF262 domain-containing protein [Lachnospiraceae bacterium]
MIKSVHDYQIDDVFKKDASFHYVIPKYQREYTWSTNQWKDLYDDIFENDFGYFIGSIICIDNSTDAYQIKPLEVVDGQQRLTTLCLLLVAIYNKLKEHKNELELNKEIAEKNCWTKEDILSRTDKLVTQLLAMFNLS